MFGSSVLDIAIGLIFVILLLSLICSAANELLEQALKKRPKDLEAGINELVGAQEFVEAVYKHGLINSLYRGNYVKGSGQLPSYIPAPNFALALLAVEKQWTAESKLLPPNVTSALSALRTLAGTDEKKLQDAVEAWFNSAMDRVSGWYRRRAKVFLVIIGFVIAVAVNADCISIVQGLSKDSALRQGVVALAEAAAKNDPTKTPAAKPVDDIRKDISVLDSLSLPIGWPAKSNTPFTDAIGEHLFGWLLTALAISLGAPFWFDVLGKIVAVRSAVKPQPKADPPQK
jgi:hypothetical protein